MKEIFRKQSARLWLLAAACAAFVFVIRPWQLYFRNDDFIHIPMPRKWLFLRGGFMRPVANFFMMADRHVYGTNATGYFVTTLFFHTLTVFVIYFLVKEIAKAYRSAGVSSGVAFITALLFLYYPWHAESLMWAIGQGSIIAAFFALLSMLLFIKSAERVGWFILSWLCFVATLFTYESIWNLPLVFIAIAILGIKQKRLAVMPALMYCGSMLITFVAYLFIRAHFLGTIAGDGYLEMNENIRKPLLVITNLLKLVGRNYTPPFSNATAFASFFVLATVALLSLIFIVCKRNRQLMPLVFVLVLCLVTAVLPAVPLGIDTHYNEGERYLYYSSFFFCFMAAVVISHLLVKRSMAVTATAVTLFVFLLLLNNLQKNYAYASVVTKTTMHTLANSQPSGTAYFIDVPDKCDGALIFRIGLKNGIEWTNTKGRFDSVIIVSQNPNAVRTGSYLPGFVKWEQLAKAKQWKAGQHFLYGDSAGYPVLEKDQVYWFSNDGFYRVVF